MFIRASHKFHNDDFLSSITCQEKEKFGQNICVKLSYIFSPLALLNPLSMQTLLLATELIGNEREIIMTYLGGLLRWMGD